MADKIILPLDGDNPFLAALVELGPKQRKAIVRQVTLLCMAIQGLEPQDALEVLARLGIWLNDRPAQMLQEDYDLRKFREDKSNGRKTNKPNH